MKKIYFLVVVLCSFISGYGQIINFPDVNLKAVLLLANTTNNFAIGTNNMRIKIDANNNGEIEISEAILVRDLDLTYYNSYQNPSAINNLTGIEKFINLEYLHCSYSPQLNSANLNGLNNLKVLYLTNNNTLSNLDVSYLFNLERLWCFTNPLLNSLNVQGLSNLNELMCSHSNLNNLNVSNLPSLTRLFCENNQLTSLNISNSLNLGVFHCENNILVTLDLSGMSHLSILNCSNNQIEILNLDDTIDLDYMDFRNNLLQSLDLSSLRYYFCLNCSDNSSLKTINLKNGYPTDLCQGFSNCPSLRYICDDEFDSPTIQNKINAYGYTNCHVNTYCSFTPEGTYYNIQGTNRLDNNGNGCDFLDTFLPNLKFNISGGTNTGSILNASGNYVIPFVEGTYIIVPVLENPNYFTVSPSTVNVTFPTQPSPFTQNFCINANGIHPDLEISLLPINAARPGFDATCKIIYKNKGNTTQSGIVNLAFNDAIIDFVSAIPATASQSVNNLYWNFTNLDPFETREITLTLNVNSPMENPAVNSGDILNYTTTITSSAIDDLPNDNTFVFNQTVVNSFDPNDKTCLQGATIAPEKVGDYVHYMIRFENTGTFPAENIVVKDIIDTAKFDVNSLIPVKGSHSFVTNISSGNKVEFIFENINLPFDDANNDGYVAFKIKTKPTLVNGNTFSNTASIYFDYNFPIVTNTATTTIAALSIQDFVFSNYFNIYPNPVSNALSITQKENITINSINIYNTLGQLILVIPNAKNTKTIDVSNLTTSNYFIKINSDKGTSNTKFVKN